ncbi:cytochrome P450 3A28 [Caerostris darwini]|uniref:Cytochrome P450 3A28 n=1 Tax=Caerostris darwini TaxID=1538125 RepID=A0AAV4RH76_9ARAC|nr:cytochrome P450 3A28 [Caerostris darwini]
MWTLTLLAVVIILFLIHRKRCFSVLKQQGIPGPEPNLLFGNMLELIRKTPIKCHEEWFKKYGKIVGYYVGTTPVVLMADVDLLKKVQVSEFHKFINRPNLFRPGQERTKNTKVKRVEGFTQHLIVLGTRDGKKSGPSSLLLSRPPK